MALLSLFLLSAASPALPETPILSPIVENVKENNRPLVHALVAPTLYFGAGTLLGSATLLAGMGWATCQLTPWASTFGNECLLSSEIFAIGAIHSFAQAFKESSLFSLFLKKIPSPYSAWYLNKKMLSQIPVFSHEDKELLHFLQERWLAKGTGCYPFLVDWMCPSFGLSLQMHPETTNSYARDPQNKLSQTYKNRVAAWKHFLPHPHHFPLILTRPSNIQNYLPSCFEIPYGEEISHSVDRLLCTKRKIDSPLIVDLTSALSSFLEKKHWLTTWHAYEKAFSKCCKEHNLDPHQILCIQRVWQEDIGGVRLLPLSPSSREDIEKQHQFLLEWVSKFGLSANRIELDRLPLHSSAISHEENSPIECEPKEQWVSSLNSIEDSWRSTHPQKTLMVKGTLQLLKDLCTALSQEKWEEIQRSPTRSSSAQLCFTKIKQQLHCLVQQEKEESFYDTASHMDQIHADLSSLLEIFAPFTAEDFPALFRTHLTSIPQDLQPLTKYGVHTSAMTSLAGIFKALEKTLGRAPHILYGENTYFECIQVVERISEASSMLEASEQEWKEVDLLIAQFNPALKRIDFKASEYHVEKISDVLHRALSARAGKPLSIALDCTLDFSDSPRIGRLLTEFQEEIKKGELNVICFRSGAKFDLFGMDNYCGSPFFIVHNQNAYWSSFDSLLTDPALQTDRLSLNWFCLAYQHAAPYLELYRKHVFDNTRAVLNRVPARLFNNNNLPYRVIPIEADADPSFIDIKVFGPFHEIRAGLLLGVLFTIKCMQAGHPLLYRPSLGFYHPNLAVLFGKEFTTVRLTLGIDPSQVDVIAYCMEKIDALNGR